MHKYRVVITYNNDLTHTFYVKRISPIKFQDFNLKDFVKEPELENIIGLHIVELD